MVRLFSGFYNICGMKYSALFFVLLMVHQFNAQTPSVVWIKSARQPLQGQLYEASIPSGYLAGRTLTIWLPDRYFSSTQAFDVVYFHDGQMLFDSTKTWNHQSWDLTNAGKSFASKERCAFVGIDNDPKNRYAEFFPAPIYPDLPLEIQTSLRDSLWNGLPLFYSYSDAIISTVFPMVENAWRVHRGGDHRTMVGSSMGAIASLTFMALYPEEVAKVACLSIHLPLVNQSLYQSRLKEPLAHSYHKFLVENAPRIRNKRIYVDRGDQSLDAFYAPYFPDFTDAMAHLASHNKIQIRLIANSGHSEQDWSKRIGSILNKLHK